VTLLEPPDFLAEEFPSEAAPGLDAGGGGCKTKMIQP